MIKIKSAAAWLSLMICLVISGCSFIPEYTRPETPAATNWPEGDAYKPAEAENTVKTAADIPINTFFVNEKLQKIIALALENNRDLRVAALNIDRMKATYRISRSSLFPHIDGAASKNVQRTPESLSFSGESAISHQYGLNVGVSAWELDFFGRIRSLKEQALQQYLATEQARHTTQMSLVSDVAGMWLTLSADQELLKLANETLDAQKASYDMMKKRSEVGASSELDLRQAETRLEAARIDIAVYTRTVALDKNALALLLGCTVPPDLMPDNLSVMDNQQEDVFRNLAPNLPSDVLLDRPDIVAAERRLMAANANIGAARAAFFPRVALTGSFGVAAADLDNLFSEGAAWSFSPQITVPIFNAGQNRANLKVSQIDRDIAVANYEQAIQTAFREVADALAQRGTMDDQLAAQKAFLNATSESYRLSEIRYKKGIDSYLNVLDAQRSLYSAQQAMIGTRLLRLTNRVTMYKVLGGGIAVE